MRLTSRIFFLFLSLLLLNGCDSVLDYDTSGCTPSKKQTVLLSVNWGDLAASAPLPPPPYTLRIDEQELKVDWLDGAYHDLPSVTTPFAALVYNEAGQIAVRIDKEVAQAAVREVSPGIIASQPDYFYTGFKQVPPSHEALTYVTVNMVQRIKLLRMTLHIDRNSDIPISGLSTTLSGVVGSIDMRSGASVDKESKSLLPIFEPSAVTKATLSRESYVSESRLFGVRKADSQQLAIRLTLQNGMTFLFNSDLTQALKEFNEVETSLDISATLKLEDTGLDTITCSITDWNVVENGDFEIH